MIALTRGEGPLGPSWAGTKVGSNGGLASRSGCSSVFSFFLSLFLFSFIFSLFPEHVVSVMEQSG